MTSALLLALPRGSAAAHVSPDVAGVRLGMTSTAVLATLQHGSIPVTRTFFGLCLDDELKRAAGRANANGPGRCVQSINARYAGGDLLIRFVEDLPRRPGSSIAVTIALNYPTDIAAAQALVQRAGPPTLTDGNDPWTIALWCFDFACADMNRTLADPASGASLLVDRGSGFTLDDPRMRTERAPGFRRALPMPTGINYGKTPQAAAMHILSILAKSTLVFDRVNIVEPYATVLSNGEVIPGEADRKPILFEHFSFGWQALNVLESRCDLVARGIGARDRKRLMRGMPETGNVRPCPQPESGDVGPTREIEAVRLLRHDLFVPSVRVVADFALVSWTNGPDGGEALYRRRSTGWKQLTGGGGALNAADLREYGVPKSVACVLLASAC